MVIIWMELNVKLVLILVIGATMKLPVHNGFNFNFDFN